jgi:Domain of unknown function (DUF4260)
MPGATTGIVRALLRLEGLAVLAASVAAYARFGSGWGLFAACFLLPDLSFLGYLANARVGAAAYNAAHSSVGGIGLIAIGAVFGAPAFVTAGLVWTAHVGFDRALGYGLKYGRGFGFTHLGPIGAAAREA